ncbi:uncharacterized protein [Rutidosis leptorrhynchoides]|uniref:uncharacterized protein n=1 Tax=Rutidosis leptorrhynchoides TaxID=125765 RepID=UPI003A9900FB
MARDFQDSGMIPRGCNASFFSLIPKKDNPIFVQDFRPISLIGLQYKIIAKCLATQLALVIDEVISPEQTAFVKGRQILDGPLIINESLSCFISFFSTSKWKSVGRIFYRAGLEARRSIISFPFYYWNGRVQAAIKDSSDSMLFQGLRIGHNHQHVTFSLSMYADDVLFVGCFFAISGLMINLHKSSLTGVGIQHQEVKKRLSSWKANMISIGGRLTLTKSVLSSIDGSKKIHWIKWRTILNPLSNGGLNVASLRSLNLALIYKWRWRFFSTRDATWVKIITSIHGPCYGNTLPVTTSNCGLWVSIVKCINSLYHKHILPLNGLRIYLGNGNLANFWHDPWLEGTPLSSRFRRLYMLDTNHSCNVAAQFVSNNWIWHWRRPPRGGIESSLLVELMSLLANVNVLESPDYWYWNEDASQLYSVSHDQS